MRSVLQIASRSVDSYYIDELMSVPSRRAHTHIEHYYSQSFSWNTLLSAISRQDHETLKLNHVSIVVINLKPPFKSLSNEVTDGHEKYKMIKYNVFLLLINDFVIIGEGRGGGGG